MERVRYAIIGFGGIAENRLAKEGFCVDRARFEAHPAAQLAGVTDVDGRRRKAAESLGLKWFETTDEVLKSDEIEAVFIATNNSTHAELAGKAIKAGKHCIIEKPVATRLSDARRIQELAAKHGRSLTVDHMMRKNAFNVLARRRIVDGYIGEVNDITLHMEFSYGGSPDEAASWRCLIPEELGGPIGDVASHCLYMAEFLLGARVVKVQCVYLPETFDVRVENGAFIQITMENGLTGSIRVALNKPRGGLIGTLSNLGYEVYGSGGVLRGYAALFQLSGHDDEPVKVRLTGETAAGLEEIKPSKAVNIYQAMIEEHALSIRNSTPLNGDDGVRNLEMILACHASARDGGKAVPV